jgi:DNA-binding response OmpR family regulator
VADGLAARRAARIMRPSLVIIDLALQLLDGHAVVWRRPAPSGPR